MRNLIVLLTDFGLEDWFVGTMKGMIKGIVPGADIIDLCHSVKPGDIQSGALTLFFSYEYFPKGTMFCCVVDPGVGTKREAIVATDGKYFFTAPNNGLLGLVAARAGKKWRCHKIEKRQFMLPEPSHTFHGRDIFAPAAAHLAKGVQLRSFGNPLKHFVSSRLPEPRRQGEKLRCEVIYIDRFGNLITNLSEEKLNAEFKIGKSERSRQLALSEIELTAGKIKITGIKKTFAEVGRGKAVMYIGSTGYLEVAINGGNAAAKLHATIGLPLYLRGPSSRRD